MRALVAHWLGRVRYAKAHALQAALVGARVRGDIDDTILLLEHDAVVTLGRGADPSHVLDARDALARRGVDVADTGRGGDVTFHAPGQLVAYPIFDLKPDRCDVRRYVRDLGRVMIALAGGYGVASGMLHGDAKLIGVWARLDDPGRWEDAWTAENVGHARIGKIGAIGVRLSRWVTMHGFAFNVSTDLSGFSLIVPCGLRDRPVVSLASLGVEAPPVAEAARAVVPHFAKVFEADARLAEDAETRELVGRVGS